MNTTTQICRSIKLKSNDFRSCPRRETAGRKRMSDIFFQSFTLYSLSLFKLKSRNITKPFLLGKHKDSREYKTVSYLTIQITFVFSRPIRCAFSLASTQMLFRVSDSTSFLFRFSQAKRCVSACFSFWEKFRKG